MRKRNNKYNREYLLNPMSNLLKISRIFSLTLLLFFSVTVLFADKYAGEIFRLGAGVRNYALGNTGVTDYKSTSLAYWNAALLAKKGVDSFELMHAEEFMGEVSYDIFSATWGSSNRYSLVLSRIGLNNIPLTRLPDPDKPVSADNQPYVYKTVNNSDYIAYFGLARAFGGHVVGISPKIAYRYLAETNGYGFGVDVSTFFDISENMLAGVNLRDAFTTQILWDNGTHEIVKPSLDTELKISITNPLLDNKANLFLGSEILFEGRKEAATHNIGNVSFDYHAGLEIPFPEFITLYGGYDIDNFTTGISLDIASFKVNYAFKHNTELDNTHRVSLAFYPN